MVDTKKFSEFLDGGDLEEGSRSVGLAGGQNARFTTLPQFLPPGTTAERPIPAIAGMIRYNTSQSAYEYFNGSLWLQFESSADISLLIARLAAHTAGDGASMIGLQDQGGVSNQTVQDLSEADFIVRNNTDALANAIALSGLNTGFIVVETGTGNIVARSLAPTANQIVISNPTGLSGNSQISFADNPEMAGTSHVRIPFGTTAQRPLVPQDGYVRYNTDLDDLEFWNSTATAWEQTASTGALTAIVQDTTPQLGGNLEANGFEIDMEGEAIINVLDPVNAQDAATKFYVDNFSSSVFLGEATANNSASIVFTDLPFHAAFLFVISALVPVTSGSILTMQVSTNNGSTFLTTAGDYKWVLFSNRDDGAQSYFADASATRIRLNRSTGNLTSSLINGKVFVPGGPLLNPHQRIISSVTSIAPSGVFERVDVGATITPSFVFNAARFLFDSGNISSGVIRVFALNS